MVALSTQYARTYTLARQAARLEQRRRALIAQNELLREEIHRLQTDDRYIERLARQQLGLVRPGEIELLIVPAGHGAGATTAAGAHPPGAAPAEEAKPEAAAGRIDARAPGAAPAGRSAWTARLRAILEWARGWLHSLTPPVG